MKHQSFKMPLKWRKRFSWQRKSSRRLGLCTSLCQQALTSSKRLVTQRQRSARLSEHSKLQAELDAVESKATDLSNRLGELEAAHEASKDDAAELKRLDKEVEKAKIALDEVIAGASALKTRSKGCKKL